ncbi:MAG TPA: dihydroorotase [Bacteroidales bacterium]|nr:dihydroorotase [Bacteroidales bacterium]
MKTLLITDALIVNEGKTFHGNVFIQDSFIKEIIPAGQPLPPSTAVIKASGKYLLPGVIDDQVHFREPGLTHKGDISSESAAAVAGGVTSFMEMPNTNPQTVTQELLQQKYVRAAAVSLANYSFYMGATNDNLEELLKTDPRSVCGIKIFMGSSTGNMLVDNVNTLKNIFSQSPMLIAVHCEDETVIRNNIEAARTRFGEDVPVYFHPVIRDEDACYRSSRMAAELASKYNTRLHILHLSTARELDLLDSSLPLKDKKITAEVCVHHLVFDSRDYFTRGNLIKWNPAIKSARDREALMQGLLTGKIDVVATDHAPHTLEEKQNTYFKAPSGGPLVQHSLTAMLEFCRQGLMKTEQVVEKMCHAPADLFHVEKRGYIRPGYYADLVIVDPDDPWTVSKDNLLYKCGWSPFTGMTFHSKVTHTLVNGNIVYEKGKLNHEFKGMRLLFT